MEGKNLSKGALDRLQRDVRNEFFKDKVIISHGSDLIIITYFILNFRITSSISSKTSEEE